ncbi:MAG: hypothetical protein HZA90_25430 [Verrucomicrobia bacterium]|nr:hypothetical protein [Verrucomicrobiota bacterium]
MCLSLVLELCDIWAATRSWDTWFSKCAFICKDGGTSGYVGFGYLLLYHRSGGLPAPEIGPEIWYWFLPFTICDTNEKTGISWVWSRRQNDLWFFFGNAPWFDF